METVQCGGGPGKVTEWINKHHADSSKKINDEKGIEASLAERIGNAGSGVSKSNFLMLKPKRLLLIKEIQMTQLNCERILIRSGKS
ncbi:hypothetical protein bmyco0003_49940 [Bacillus pseudomycoides]|nr:hypothetical protein bmyco0003_49940 [Bacillus pseudomycoides]